MPDLRILTADEPTEEDFLELHEAQEALLLTAKAYSAETRRHQAQLNKWTDKFLRGVPHLREDGISGRATRARVMGVKYYLGYDHRDATWETSKGQPLSYQMWNPGTRKYFKSWAGILKGRKRRLAQRAAYRRSQIPTGDLITIDGVRVSAAVGHELLRARRAGAKFQVISGYRTPAYSEHLCYLMCGHPQCPGRCAGRATNHALKGKVGSGRGAADIAIWGYWSLSNTLHRIGSPLHNALPNDHNHFSFSGR